MILIARRNRLARRGVSLIELLVVMTILAVLLSLCAVTVQLLLRLDSDAQAKRSASASLGRLADQFREDIHACDGVEFPSAGGLRLSRERGVAISYSVREGRVERVETVAGQASRCESYNLGRSASAVFERRDDGPRRFLALVVTQTSRAGRPDPPRPMEILALVGKDRPEPRRSKGGQAR